MKLRQIKKMEFTLTKTITTENLQKIQRYIPHTLETRLAKVKTYRNKNSISFICRRYKVSKASLMRY